MHRRIPLLGLALAAFLLGPAAQAKPAKHRPKRPRTVTEGDFSDSKSYAYGALDRSGCLAELKKRKVSFSEVDDARGVTIPIRLKGALGGVTYRTELPPSQRPTSPHEVMDCRLALALSDLSVILQKHDVEEALIFSAWRPPAKSWPKDKEAIRHPGGLAIDIRRLVKKQVGSDKAKDLIVERDWAPAPNQDGCSTEARAKIDKTDKGADAREIRAIFCEARDARIFTSMLSPNYDTAHHNHFHFEIRPGVKWRLVL
jgi:hypothetical protein